MDDLISRQAAIDAIGEKPFAGTGDEYDYEQGLQNQWERDVVAIKILPSAQPEEYTIEMQEADIDEAMKHLRNAKVMILPSAQPKYEPVKAEDFAKTMSENSLYNFVTWHQEALTLMKEQGFVICKKT